MKIKNIKMKIFHIFVIMMIFKILNLISTTKMTVYLFEWTSRNHYLFLWLFAVLFVIFHKPLIGYAISIGNVFGIAVGQFLGDYIIKINSTKLTINSTPEEYYRFTYHYGVFIWILIVIISFLSAYCLIKNLLNKLSKYNFKP